MGVTSNLTISLLCSRIWILRIASPGLLCLQLELAMRNSSQRMVDSRKSGRAFLPSTFILRVASFLDHDARFFFLSSGSSQKTSCLPFSTSTGSLIVFLLLLVPTSLASGFNFAYIAISNIPKQFPWLKSLE